MTRDFNFKVQILSLLLTAFPAIIHGMFKPGKELVLPVTQHIMAKAAFNNFGNVQRMGFASLASQSSNFNENNFNNSNFNKWVIGGGACGILGAGAYASHEDFQYGEKVGELIQEIQKNEEVKENNKLSSFVQNFLGVKPLLMEQKQELQNKKKLEKSDLKEIVRTHRGSWINSFSSLHYFARCGDKKAVEDLLGYRVSVKDTDGRGETALFYACKNGHFEIVELLVKHGANVNHINNKKKNALDVLLKQKNLEESDVIKITELLLDHEIKTPDRWGSGNTTLHIAAQNGSIKVVELLLEKGAKVNVADNKGRTPLYYAVLEGHLELVKYLVARGASVHLKLSDDAFGKSLLDLAVWNDDRDMLYFFLDQYNDWSAIELWQALYESVNPVLRDTKPEISKLLVSKGASLSFQPKKYKGDTLLHLTVARPKKEGFRFLLDNGANPNIQNEVGNTPLHKAVKYCSVEEVQLLLDSGANPNIQNRYGETPLHVLVEYLNSRILKEGDDSLFRDGYKIIKALLEKNADPFILNRNNKQPYEIIKDTRFWESELNKCYNSLKPGLITRLFNKKQ